MYLPNEIHDAKVFHIVMAMREEFTTNKDLYLFVGTTLQFHRRKTPNPFVIIGVFYPPKEKDTFKLSF